RLSRARRLFLRTEREASFLRTERKPFRRASAGRPPQAAAGRDTMATAISADQVKKLRDQTGAGMMECKNALSEANGDFEEANTILRKRGLASAAKKAGRMASEGLIGQRLSRDHSAGTLVEVNCESDFVARTPDFQELMMSVLDEIDKAGD